MIEQKIFSIFKKVLDLNQEELNINLNINNCEKWDSTAHLNIIFSIEEEFNMSFGDKDISDLDSLNKIIDYVKKI